MKNLKTSNKRYNVLQNILYIIHKVFQWQKVLLPILIGGIFVQSTMAFVSPFVMKIIIDEISSEKSLNFILFTILIIVCIEMVLMFSNTWINNQIWWRIMNVKMKFSTMRIKKILSMDYEKLEQPNILNSSQKAGEALRGSRIGVEGLLNSVLAFFICFMKIGITITIISSLSILLLLFILILSVIRYYIVNHMKKIDKNELWNKLMPNLRMTNYLSEVTKNNKFAKDIRIFGMFYWLYKKLSETNNYAHKKIVESKDRWIKCGIWNQGISTIQEILLYSWLIYNILSKKISLGDFTLYLGVVRSFAGTVATLLDNLVEMQNQSEQVNDFREFIDCLLPVDKVSFHHPMNLHDFDFTFKNVAFKYSGQTDYVLKNVNLSIKSGEHLAIVGLNGSGKTTLIKLLQRLYEPTSGRIIINGVDIKEITKSEYYAIFAPLFQDIEMFAFPISENVSMKTPTETDIIKVNQCLKLAGISDKIKSLPRGAMTELLKVLHDDGIDLSSGEKQKIALARMLYKDAPIIILDEPASSLDALSEYELYRNLDDLFESKTVIYITHRLSSTRFCNSIAVIHQGEIQEYGTHDELLNLGGIYSNMFYSQAQYYTNKNKEEKENVEQNEMVI